MSRAARKIREVGVGYALTLGLRRLLPAGLARFTRMVILEIVPGESALAGADRSPLPAGRSVRWADRGDVPMLEQLGHAFEVVDGRMMSGASVCVAVEGERILAYVWFHAAEHDEEDLGVRFTLGPGEIWLFDAMVRSDQRGRGLYPVLLEQAVRDLGGRGVGRILIAVEERNRNSLRAHQAVGARVIGVVAGLRVLGFVFARTGGRVRAGWTGARGYVPLPTSEVG